MDEIFIEHLALRGRHGVSDEERSKAQEFVVDIKVEFDTRTAAASDVLDDTIDYNFFRDGARQVVEKQSFKLLERLADAVAQKVLEHVRISTATVSIRKTEMYPDCTPGVTIVRTR